MNNIDKIKIMMFMTIIIMIIIMIIIIMIIIVIIITLTIKLIVIIVIKAIIIMIKINQSNLNGNCINRRINFGSCQFTINKILHARLGYLEKFFKVMLHDLILLARGCKL